MLRRALLDASRQCRRTSLNAAPPNRRGVSNLKAPPVQTIGALHDHGLSYNTGGESGWPKDYVEVNGFVRSVRKQKRVAFAALSDGTTLEPLQIVLTPEQAEGLSTGVAVKARGIRVESRGAGQEYEVQAERVTVMGDNDATTYPIQKKYQTAEFLRTLPHLRSRVPLNSLLLRLRSLVISSVTNFFDGHDFVQTHTPILTSSDCEGAGEVFTIQTAQDGSGEAQPEHFFRSPKYLTVSAQLHLEALAQSITRVWTLSPTFRAEKSDTPRHLSEFYMLEAEMCFVNDMGAVMDVLEEMLKRATMDLQDSRLSKELLTARGASDDAEHGSHTVSPAELKARWKGITEAGLRPSWPRITYKEAIRHLQKAVQQGTQFVYSPEFGASLQAEHEKYLAQSIGEGSPIFVTDYPRDIKAFYMSPSDPARSAETGPDTVACFDLLVPDLCELAGGSMREHRLDALQETMRRNNMRVAPPSSNTTSGQDTTNPQNQTDAAADLEWYLDLRRYGSVPHGGFGLGFDRLLGYLSGTSNIRDVVAFPRWYGRCDC